MAELKLAAGAACSELKLGHALSPLSVALSVRVLFDVRGQRLGAPALLSARHVATQRRPALFGSRRIGRTGASASAARRQQTTCLRCTSSKNLY